MRASKLLVLPLFAALVVVPDRAPAQVSATTHLGRAVTVTNYAPDVYGDWHTNYRRWRPIAVYYLNGQYYPRAVRGARRVEIYRWNNRYFLPPHDQAWNKTDRRYDYRHQPVNDDYNHVAPPPARPRPRP